jgi:hypothetical protein
MPYPPKPRRKYPELTVAEARTQHLTPYQFKPGEPQPNNPRGLTNAQRQQYQEAKELLHQAGPLAIKRLIRLAGIDLEGNTLLPDEELADPRVVLVAAQNLAERIYGRPKEMLEPAATEAAEPRHVQITVGFVPAPTKPAFEMPAVQGPTGQIIDTTPLSGSGSHETAKLASEAAAMNVESSGGLRKVGPPARALRAPSLERPVQNASGFSGRR